MDFKTFQKNKSLQEAEDSIAKPNAADSEETTNNSDNEKDLLYEEIVEKVTSCVDTLKSLHETLEGTNISQTKIDSFIADLSAYAKNVQEELDNSSKSNQVNKD